jgi:hypothetical protein
MFPLHICSNVICKTVQMQTIPIYIGFDLLTAVVMNVSMFWDIVPCGPYANRRFGGKYHPHLQGWKSAEQETDI